MLRKTRQRLRIFMKISSSCHHLLPATIAVSVVSRICKSRCALIHVCILCHQLSHTFTHTHTRNQCRFFTLPARVFFFFLAIISFLFFYSAVRRLQKLRFLKTCGKGKCFSFMSMAGTL